MGLEAAVFIGIFAGISNVIPYFGPVIGMIPAFLMGLCTGGFWHGVLAIAILCHTADRRQLHLSESRRLPRPVSIRSWCFWQSAFSGTSAAILGMILAVPLAGIIQVFVVKWASSKESRAKRTETEPPRDM